MEKIATNVGCHFLLTTKHFNKDLLEVEYYLLELSLNRSIKSHKSRVHSNGASQEHDFVLIWLDCIALAIGANVCWGPFRKGLNVKIHSAF